MILNQNINSIVHLFEKKIYKWNYIFDTCTLIENVYYFKDLQFRNNTDYTNKIIIIKIYI